jgi:hypothetical protein
MSDDYSIKPRRVCKSCGTGWMVEMPHYKCATYICDYCHSTKTYPSEQMPKGWSCPRCNKVYSPSVPSCTDCNNKGEGAD